MQRQDLVLVSRAVTLNGIKVVPLPILFRINVSKVTANSRWRKHNDTFAYKDM